MTNYEIPNTPEERLNEFKKYVHEFLNRYEEFNETNKKVAGFKARKALLGISKLYRPLRVDLQDKINKISKQ